MPCRFNTLILSFVFLAVPAWADYQGYQAGMDAYDRGDYATALREWRPLAVEGNPGAQFNLGQLYLKGHGVPQNFDQARQWFERAAVRGQAIAQYNLGLLYDSGQGVPQDYLQARQWYEKAAVQGRPEAQASLGTLYLTGHGVPQDYPQALFWFRVAQTKLGLMYERGNGVTQDIVLAHKWYIVGAASGDKVGAEHRDALAKHMTPAQIFRAKELAREWKPISQ
jgi:TPR repeat protein